jgi:hypothetical protein
MEIWVGNAKCLCDNAPIYFKRKNHPAVSWGNLKYDYDDNDRQVLFDEISSVELIFLMKEMDAELRQAGCSILTSR